MNAKKPFGTILPPGSPLARASVQRRSHVRKVVFVGVAVGVFGVALLLIGSCIQTRHNGDSTITAATNVSTTSSMTNTSILARLPVVVSNSQADAPKVPDLRPSSPPFTPVPTPKSAPLLTAQGATMKNYSVVSGDTFSKIASVVVRTWAMAMPPSSHTLVSSS